MPLSPRTGYRGDLVKGAAEFVDRVHQHCDVVRRGELRDAVPQVENMSRARAE